MPYPVAPSLASQRQHAAHEAFSATINAASVEPKPPELLISDWRYAPLSCFALVVGRRLKALGWMFHGLGDRCLQWGINRLEGKA